MSEVVGEGILRIRTDSSSVPGDVSKAGSDAGKGYSKGFLGGVKGLAVAVGGLLAADKVLDFAKASVGEAREAQKVGAATEAIIKATGSAANVTAAQVSDLAGAISEKAGVDDEAIQKGQNLLLTFKNVRNEVGKGADIFNRATQAAVDLSAAGFGSIEGGSKMLGKALNDPVAGISALSRAGVTFTEQQKKQIKAMVESGDTLAAQKVILAEVEGQVGGVAEATATAGDRAAVVWGNVQEEVGARLLPILDKLALFFVDTMVPAIREAIEWAGQFAPVVNAIGAAVAAAFADGGQASAFFEQLASVASTVLPVIVDVLVNDIAPAWLATWQAIGEAALPILTQLGQFIVGSVVPALVSLAGYIQANVLPVVLQAAAVFRESIIPAVAAVASFVVTQMLPALAALWQQVATNLKPVFDQLVVTFQTQLLPTIQKAAEYFRTRLLPVLQPIIMKVIQVGSAFVKVASFILGKVLPVLIRFAGWWISNFFPLVGKIISGISKVIGFLVSLGKGIANAIGWVVKINAQLQKWVADGIASVVRAVSQLPGKLLALGGRLFNAGKSIIGKFLDGLRGAGSLVSDIAGNVWDALQGLINSAIDNLNAALEFEISIPGPNVHINPPNIGHIQGGTESWRGGLAMVGEVGQELVNMPRGAQVSTAAQTRQMLDGGGLDYAALGAAIAKAIAPLLRPIELTVPTDDPEALAMSLLNRLAAAS